MVAIPGSVRVTGFIAPSDTADVYATQDETYNRGGLRAVADATARLAITSDRRKEGMLVKQLDTGIFWTLTGGIADINWTIQYFTAGSDHDTVRWVGNYRFPIDTRVDGAWLAPENCTIVAVWVDVEERGTNDGGTADTIWDVNLNGVTIFTTQANRPTISSSGGGGEASVQSGAIDPLMTTVLAGDRLTVDTDQVANGTTRPATFAVTLLVVF